MRQDLRLLRAVSRRDAGGPPKRSAAATVILASWLRAAVVIAASALATPTASAAENTHGACLSDDPDTAIRGCTAELALKSRKAIADRPYAYSLRAHAYVKKGDYARALADRNEAVRLAPKDGLQYVNRGGTFERMGDLDRALVDYEAALRVQPGLEMAKSARDRVRGKISARAVPTRPDYSMEKCASAEVSGADLDARIRACTEVIARGDTTPATVRAGAFLNRGNLYHDKKDDEHALSDLTEAIRLDRKLASAYFYRALIYRYSRTYQDLDRAIADLDEAIRLSPNRSLFLSMRGEIWLSKDDPARALGDFEAALRIEPGSQAAVEGRDEAQADLAAASIPHVSTAAPADPAGEWLHKGLGQIRIAPCGGALCGTISWAKDPAAEENNPDIMVLKDMKPAGENHWEGNLYNAHNGETIRATMSLKSADALRICASGGECLKLRRSVATGAPSTQATEPVPPSVASPAAPQAATAAPAALVLAPAPVAQAPNAVIVPAIPEIRIALVIGNSAYSAVTPLSNPARDAQAVAQALRNVGFRTVTLESDVTRERMMRALQSFAAQAVTADWAVIYYAGHGIEVGGANYLIPVDAALKADRDVQFEAVPLEQVLASIEGAKKLRLVLLDACRDNPFVRQMTRTLASRSVGRGLAPPPEPDGGTLVAYAAKHGQVALDGDGQNSPFVSALIKHLQAPGVEINKLFRLVRNDVMAATGRLQEPFVYGSLPPDDFFFKSPQAN